MEKTRGGSFSGSDWIEKNLKHLDPDKTLCKGKISPLGYSVADMKTVKVKLGL